ncbi:MAG: excinuclease ABC subunit UvrC [Kiritimatiellae bacterium]|nr:excinuclease ABC subunit UvrC [Kiritimatiellia bacterium]
MNPELREKLRGLPDKPGCYLMRDRKGAIIYVGKALSLRKRVGSYFRPSAMRNAPPKLRSMVNSVEDLEVVVVRNETEALLTESTLIKQYKPRFNVLLRDDKRYMALKADPQAPVPRLSTCRIIRNDGAIYFGPFPSSVVVRTVQDFVEKRYGLRKCAPIQPDAETYKHCINDIIRFCSAPCIGRVSAEEYREKFEEACAFLRGERLAVIEEVKELMQEASEKLDFEKAARLRDTWLALRMVVKERARTQTPPEIQRKDALDGIRELMDLLNLPQTPHRIEGFDISNLFGTHSVASMVVATDGIPDKRYYRRFRIKTIQGADDPRSMAEVINRRYQRLRDENQAMPELIMVDGGITQLRAAREALHALGVTIPVIGLAEQMEEIVVDNDQRQSIFLPHDTNALKVLMRLRDEAHRFALDYHRRLRNRTIRESALDEIPGVGPARKNALLKYFGSVYRLARASVDEIAAVPGIDQTLAQAIHRAVISR